MNGREVYYEVAKRRLDEQLGEVDSMDSKATAAFAFSSSVLAAFAILFTIPHLNVRFNWPTVLFFAALGVSVLTYIGVVWLLYLAYRVAEWSFNPALSDLAKALTAGNSTDNEILEWVGDEWGRSVEANRPRVADKRRYLGWALRLLPLEAIALVLASMLTFPLR
jgi:hypothetical protein